MVKKCYRFLTGILIYLFFSGCGLHASGLGAVSGNRSFIDAPLDETISEVFVPITFTTHANFRVDRILLWIDKEPADPAAHKELDQIVEEVTPGLYQAFFPWTPEIPGRYKVMAFSYTDGRINDWDSWTTHTIHLEINERATGGGGMPTPLPTSPAVITPSTAAPPQISFSADALNLTSGSCTSLRWEAVFVEQLTLDGEAVAFSGSRQVCPAATASYTLRGTSATGEAEKAITISVAPPEEELPPAEALPDTFPPSITNVASTAGEIFDNPNCGPESSTISAKVQDDGGIAKVELHYRVRTPKQTGSWRSVAMTASGGSKYSATLNSGKLAASLANYTPGTVEFLVKAWDTSSNLSQSVQLTFKASYCLF